MILEIMLAILAISIGLNVYFFGEIEDLKTNNFKLKNEVEKHDLNNEIRNQSTLNFMNKIKEILSK